MIHQVPYFVSILFMLTTFLTLWFFYKASDSKFAIFILIAWISIQAIITQSNFYLETTTFPPRFLLLVVPPLFIILYLFFSKQGRFFLDSLNTTWLTYLHAVRVPVEITLYYLFMSSLVPELMTFEGRNFDILSGISAPVIAYVGYNQKKLSKTLLLVWNFLCMTLLANIVTTAVLSAPFPFQQLAFDQPNVGVLYFPFSWLPGCIVPLVLFSHLVCIRELLKK